MTTRRILYLKSVMVLKMMVPLLTMELLLRLHKMPFASIRQDRQLLRQDWVLVVPLLQKLNFAMRYVLMK